MGGKAAAIIMAFEMMNVRFERIEINNFKNVRHGVVDFIKTDTADYRFKPSLLGLYGQNGSGKTALIQCFDILKFLMTGNSIPADVWDMISAESPSSEITADLVITNNKNQKYSARYTVELKKSEEEIGNSSDIGVFFDKKKKVVVSKEKLSASFRSNDNSKKNVSMSPVIDYDIKREDIFLPSTKLKLLTNNSAQSENKLLVNKQISYETSRSFVFSAVTLNELRKNCRDSFIVNVLENTVYFANVNFFVISVKDSALIDLNLALPINFKTEKGNNTTIGKVMINFAKESLIPASAFEQVKEVLSSINKVLCQIIPGLSVGLEKEGKQTDKNGVEFIQVQIYSLRNGRKISMVNESEGIKKIVSILQLLIVVYNNPSTTVVIDELDSGVFEYLLGELLRIISKSAKGQLIFTSHNLRALETIDKKFVCFSTTNTDNRYIKMTYVAKNNNLRDFYFHEIMLNGQKEELYEPTHNGEIALAFREAGEAYGS